MNDRKEDRAQDEKVPATDRSIALVFAVAEHPGSNLQEIVRLCGLTKSTTHRLLTRLEALGVVDRDPVTFRYQIGRKLVRAVQQNKIDMDVRSLARPIMVRLRDRFGETISLHELTGVTLTVIEFCEPQADIRRVVGIGRQTPVDRGATAKAILAHLPPEDRSSLLRKITSPNQQRALERELPGIRKLGFAVSAGEISPGLTALSTPVFHRGGEIWGGLSVSGPSFRFTKSLAKTSGSSLVEAAAELSSLLGGGKS